MANIKSAQKRISTIDRRNSENRYVRAKLSTMIKNFRKMLEEGRVEDAEKYSREVYSYIDSACSKGVIHKNTASRKVGRLASALYKAKNVTPAPEKEVKAEAKVEEPKAEETKVEETKEEVKAEKKSTKTTKAKAEPKAEKTTEKKATTKTAAAKKEATTEKKTTKTAAAKKTTK